MSEIPIAAKNAAFISFAIEMDHDAAIYSKEFSRALDKALDAAAPHLMAEAWSAGRGAGQMDPHGLYPTPNPYRSNP